MRAIALLAVAAFFSLPAAAQEIDVSFSNDAIRGIFATPIQEHLRVDGGWLYNSDTGDDITLGLTYTGSSKIQSEALTWGVGGRVAYVDGDANRGDGFAFAPGGWFRWVLSRWNRFSISRDIWWAPRFPAPSDPDDYTDMSIRAAYSITKQLDVYVGARYVKSEMDNRPSLYLDNGMNLGLVFRF